MNTELHGPWRFTLNRIEDETGISGTGHIADGVQFYDGTCVLRWLTKQRSTAVYSSSEDLIAIHGHGGKTEVRWVDQVPTAAFTRGAGDAYQDRCENVPYGSVGSTVVGEVPKVLVAPKYIAPEDEKEYLRGYVAQAAIRG